MSPLDSFLAPWMLKVTLDRTKAPRLIAGELIFDNVDINLDVESILVQDGGHLFVGALLPCCISPAPHAH